jgi:hypothetical protein
MSGDGGRGKGTAKKGQINDRRRGYIHEGRLKES